MSDFGEVIDKQTIRFERLFPGPVDRLWRYLTDPEKRRLWFADGPMEPRAGGTLTFYFMPAQMTAHDPEPPEKYKGYGEGARMNARILAFDPPRLLSFMWGENDDASQVTIELSEEGGKARLVLTHTRLPGITKMRDVAGGWHIHLMMLEDLLADGPRRPFWQTLDRLETAYEERIG